MKKASKEIFAIFCSMIILLTSISFANALSNFFDIIPNVKAQQGQVGCCIKTTVGNNACIDTLPQECVSGYYHLGQSCNALSECARGTCVPESGGCQAQKTNAECAINLNGTWHPESITSVEDCQLGCCDIPGTNARCEVITKAVCGQQAGGIGGLPFNFTAGLTSERDCKLTCAGQDQGCCMNQIGSCSYGFRSDCTGETAEFYKDTFCSAIPQKCGVSKSQSYSACGKLATTTEDVYWFDSRGNQESIKENCNYPTKICKQTVDEASGKPNATCIGTCSLSWTGAENKGTIIWSDESKSLTKDKSSLNLGNSLCYNNYEDQYSRSTGLANYILHCSRGNIINEKKDDARTLFCKMTSGGYYGNWFEPNSTNCRGCGKDGDVWNDIVDTALIIPWGGTAIDWLVTLGSSPCPLDLWGGNCEAHGDCKYEEDLPVGGWPGVGSCVPKYTPGNDALCGDCGKGGDASANICDKQECDALGDCLFVQGAGEIWRNIGYAALTALAIPAITCVIICAFPPLSAAEYPTCVGGCWKLSYQSVQAFFGSFSFWGVALSRVIVSFIANVVLANMIAGIWSGDCVAETPLDYANAKCSTCGEDYQVCTPKRCTILGDCEYKESIDRKEYQCILKECKDADAPVPTLSAKFYAGNNLVKTSTTSSAVDAGEVPWNVTSISLTANTTKYAKCQYVIDKIEQEYGTANMTDFNNNGLYKKSQNVSIPITGAGLNHTIYVKCSNTCSKTTPKYYDSYYVKFKIGETPDFIPPKITYVDPYQVYVSNELPSITAQFWLDENGTCKYSTKKDNLTANWSLMHLFSQPSINDSVISGGCAQNKKCSGTELKKCAHCNLTLNLTAFGEEVDWMNLPANFSRVFENEGINQSQKWDYVIRCEDTSHHIGDAMNYSIITIPGYNMTINTPARGSETYDRHPEINVLTIPRSTTCKYSVDANKAWDEKTVIGNLYEQNHTGRVVENLTATASGTTHTLYVTCEDYARIRREANVSFVVRQDISPPLIVRAYYDTTTLGQEMLKIVTDEVSNCKFSLKDCKFNFEEGDPMPFEESTEHVAAWNPSVTYYIKCKDMGGIGPQANTCSATIRPYEIITGTA